MSFWKISRLVSKLILILNIADVLQKVLFIIIDILHTETLPYNVNFQIFINERLTFREHIFWSLQISSMQILWCIWFNIAFTNCGRKVIYGNKNKSQSILGQSLITVWNKSDFRFWKELKKAFSLEVHTTFRQWFCF